MDSIGGTTAVSVCAGNSICTAVYRVIHTRASGNLRLIDLDLEPSCQWWTDDDPFDPTTSEMTSAWERAEFSDTGTASEPASMPAPLNVAHTAPGQTRRLSGETLVDDRRSW
ncbi:hypothetical protein N7486_003159 [Penicillium sp. IBT 16267x]|nr:hypothetical protein N7486_003159 [Penicillium sp. IBT 16267x]